VAAPNLRAIAAVTWRGWMLLPRMLVLLAWLLLRQRGAHRRARRMLMRAVKAARLGDDPLRPLAPGLWQVAPWFLHESSTRAEHTTRAADGRGAEPADGALTVVHLLGTGENVYSPLIGLVGLCLAEPRLRALRHVVADSSYEAGSYLGPSEFATRLRRTLAPLFAGAQRLALVGLSRGGTVALTFGSELADEHGVRVGVLALAPPFAHSHGRPPASAINIGGFEPIVVNFARQLELSPWLRPFGRAIVRDLYLRFSAFVLAELRMVSEASVAMFARHVTELDPIDACMRSVREFALLGRVSDAELRHAISGVTRRLARASSAHAIVCWGQDDSWVDVEPCHALLCTLVERDQVPKERLRVVKLPGLDHGVGREPEQDFAPVAALLWEACEHASRAASPAPTSEGARTESTA
jgi:hypothetical protein